MWQIVLLGKHVGYFKQTTLWHSSTCLQWVRCSVHPGWFPPHYVADRHSPLDKIQTHSGDGLYTERHSQARIELEILPRCLLAVSCRSFHSGGGGGGGGGSKQSQFSNVPPESKLNTIKFNIMLWRQWGYLWNQDISFDRAQMWYFCNIFNFLGPGDAIWRWRSLSTPVQAMACCLTAQNHYLNQCWFIISKVLWHSFKDIIIWRCQSVKQD